MVIFALIQILTYLFKYNHFTFAFISLYISLLYARTPHGIYGLCTVVSAPFIHIIRSFYFVAIEIDGCKVAHSHTELVYLQSLL